MPRLIDADKMRETLLWCKEQSGSYDDYWDDVIERLDSQPTVGGWISVKDRLPENAKHPGAFCPRYLVYTDYGITEGWYNPDMECWYGFITFMTEVYEVWNIDLERGDVPKRIKNLPVKYWMPLPEPPESCS